MIRRRAPFERQRRGTDITVNLAADERHLLRRLLGEVRELMSAFGVDRNWAEVEGASASQLEEIEQDLREIGYVD